MIAYSVEQLDGLDAFHACRCHGGSLIDFWLGGLLILGILRALPDLLHRYTRTPLLLRRGPADRGLCHGNEAAGAALDAHHNR